MACSELARRELSINWRFISKTIKINRLWLQFESNCSYWLIVGGMLHVHCSQFNIPRSMFKLMVYCSNAHYSNVQMVTVQMSPVQKFTDELFNALCSNLLFNVRLHCSTSMVKSNIQIQCSSSLFIVPCPVFTGSHCWCRKCRSDVHRSPVFDTMFQCIPMSTFGISGSRSYT